MSHGLAIQFVGKLEVAAAKEMIGFDGRRLAKSAAHDFDPGIWPVETRTS